MTFRRWRKRCCDLGFIAEVPEITETINPKVPPGEGVVVVDARSGRAHAPAERPELADSPVK